MPGILAKETLTLSRGKRTATNFWLPYGRLRGDAGSLAGTLMMTVKPASIRKSSPLQNPSLVSFENSFLRCLLDSSSMKPAAARSPHGLRRTYFCRRKKKSSTRGTFAGLHRCERALKIYGVPPARCPGIIPEPSS